jgi:hypothetical protein
MTFNEWVEFAIRADDIIFEGNKGRDDRTKSYTGRAASTGPTASTTQAPRQRIPQTEIDRRKSAGLCIKCGKQGHHYAGCKEPSFTDKYTKGAIRGKEGHIEEEEEESSESGKE